MNQEAFFACSDYISGSLSIPDLFRNMQNCTDYLASKGIGAIHTVSGVGFVANLDITIEKLFAKSLRNGFQIRVVPQALNIKVEQLILSGKPYDSFRSSGCLTFSYSTHPVPFPSTKTMTQMCVPIWKPS